MCPSRVNAGALQRSRAGSSRGRSRNKSAAITAQNTSAAACDALAQRTRSADSLTQRDVSLEEATLAWLAHDSDEGAIDHG